MLAGRPVDEAHDFLGLSHGEDLTSVGESERRDRVRALFQRFDTDADGRISETELAVGIKQVLEFEVLEFEVLEFGSDPRESIPAMNSVQGSCHEPSPGFMTLHLTTLSQRCTLTTLSKRCQIAILECAIVVATGARPQPIGNSQVVKLIHSANSCATAIYPVNLVRVDLSTSRQGRVARQGSHGRHQRPQAQASEPRNPR